MTSFRDLYSSIRTRIPSLPLSEAQSAVRSAWLDIRQAKPWSWLYGEGFLEIPNSVAGTATIIAGNTITIDPASYTALHASDTAVRPVIGRQFRVGIGPLYTINNFVSGGGGTGVITLDVNFVDDLTAPVSFLVYKAYYSPPSSCPVGTFKSYESVVSRVRNRPLFVEGTRFNLDLISPQRSYFGPPYVLAQHQPNANGDAVYELFPHPVSQDILLCFYRTKGNDLINDTDTIAPQVSASLVMAKARSYAFEWAAASVGGDKSLQGVNWLNLKTAAEAEYELKLRKANMDDRSSQLRIGKQTSVYRPSFITVNIPGGSPIVIPAY